MKIKRDRLAPQAGGRESRDEDQARAAVSTASLFGTTYARQRRIAATFRWPHAASPFECEVLMTELEYSRKLEELDRLLNDPTVPMQPDRIWSLLADVSKVELRRTQSHPGLAAAWWGGGAASA